MTDHQQKVIKRCDRTMFGALCAMIWFIPITAAMVEWCFVISFIAFIIKRRELYYVRYDELTKADKKPSIKEQFFLFLKAYAPVESFINKPIGIFCFISFVSIFTSVYPVNTFQSFFFNLLQGVYTCYMAVEVFRTRKRIKTFVLIFLTSNVLITINGITQYFTGTSFVRGHDMVYGRIASSFNHANDFAAYLIVGIPVLLCLSVFQWTASLQHRDVYYKQADQSGIFSSKKFIVATFVLFILMSIAVGLTYSRGAWLALGLSIIFMLIRKPKFLVTFILIGCLFLTFFIPKMISERTSNLEGDIKRIFTMSSRDANWRSAMYLIKRHPLLGVGMDSYTQVAENYKVERPEYPHNCYLHLAAETGLLGLFSFLWIIFVLFRKSLMRLREISDFFPHHLLSGLLTGIGAFLMHSFLDTNFYTTRLSSLMWIMIGLILSIIRVETQNVADNSTP